MLQGMSWIPHWDPEGILSPKYSNIQSTRYVLIGFPISWLGADYMEQ